MLNESLNENKDLTVSKRNGRKNRKKERTEPVMESGDSFKVLLDPASLAIVFAFGSAIYRGVKSVF